MNHLDDRQLLVQSRPGEITKPDAVKAIDGEGRLISAAYNFAALFKCSILFLLTLPVYLFFVGMPFHRNPFTKGRLFILFEVKFPANESLSAPQVRPIY